jgi:hypothetical protein
VPATPASQDDDTGIATISLRFDTQVVARVDAAKRLGISRTAWLHLPASDGPRNERFFLKIAAAGVAEGGRGIRRQIQSISPARRCGWTSAPVNP